MFHLYQGVWKQSILVLESELISLPFLLALSYLWLCLTAFQEAKKGIQIAINPLLSLPNYRGFPLSIDQVLV